MKNLLFLLFGVLFLVAGCKKDDPTPKTPSQATVGVYNMSSIKDGTSEFSLPITLNGVTLSGTVTVAAISGQDAKVNLTLTIKQTGKPDETDTISSVELQTGSPGYNLVYQGNKIGTIDGTTLILTEDNTTITAKR